MPNFREILGQSLKFIRKFQGTYLTTVYLLTNKMLYDYDTIRYISVHSKADELNLAHGTETKKKQKK